MRVWTGIPTRVGFGPMKTRAKRADHIARTVPALNGVCHPTDPVQYDHRLCRIHVGELWGIVLPRSPSSAAEPTGFEVPGSSFGSP
ncbi:hypothetical protein [Methylobacterium sp. PvR107]|uniref:hypothetical protein n=1 Tax=Methylobacterium sp. PvR107 TaxID=2806597 RepID=UPI001AE98974|nr:hypothetical protein [Methylobacterium sp. PvR107]MBP1180795.1 hypothetical protein [Methylobacterium sp. PvR107]